MAGRWRDGIQSGLRSAQPAFGAVSVGSLYFVTDEGVLERSTGAAWVEVAINETGHDALDHTGLTGVGGGGATDLVSGAYKRTAGSYTTTSSTFADVDGTNFTFTKTTGARRVMIGLVGSVESTVSGDIVSFDVAVDGTRVGGTDGIVVHRMPNASYRQNCSFTWMSDVLTADSHTFKLQWKRLAGTGTLTLHGTSASQAGQFWVAELYVA